MMISIVVPLFNEIENVAELVEEVKTAMDRANLAFELILVDDGSTDGTVEKTHELRKSRPYLTIIEFRRNFGQTAAMAAGFDHARGEIVIPLDGDLQNDPNDIPRLIAKLNEGYDVVSGWRKHRKDKFVTRKIPSWLANRLIGKITGVALHDYGCTLKAYRREVIDQLRLYGEMHRFLPAMASWSGARVTEMAVNHRPRTRGQTKYGLNRTFKVILDLITIKFLGSFSTKPLHIFGGVGILTMLAAVILGCFVLYQKLSPEHLPFNRNALFMLSAGLVMMSVQFLLMGLLAEMLSRTYHESQNKPTYTIRRITRPDNDDTAAPESGNDNG